MNPTPRLHLTPRIYFACTQTTHHTLCVPGAGQATPPASTRTQRHPVTAVSTPTNLAASLEKGEVQRKGERDALQLTTMTDTALLLYRFSCNSSEDQLGPHAYAAYKMSR